jgi:DNA-binding NarL/FixJ family response regulator
MDEGRNALILLVDDDENFTRLVGDFLNYRGYEVITKNSADSAIESLVNQQPDLIISDVMMPGIDGFEFLRMVKENSSTSHVPFIFLSARGQTASRIFGLQSGATVYLEKPFDPEVLVAQIEACLRQALSFYQYRSKSRKLAARLDVDESVRLTNAEKIVARLVAEGKTNIEIANTLNVSKRTIESHISHILGKTRLNNRTEISLWAIENNFFDSP